MTFPVSRVTWRPCYRIVPSRFPPIDLFERVAEPGDRELLQELEGATSPRLREQAGEIHLVRDEDRRYGPGWTPVMAAFCHFNSRGTRFTDGTFGAYYTAMSEATAIAETRYHTERFLRESDEPPMQVQQRVYLANLDGELLDLRGSPPGADTLLAPDDWRASQAFGRRAWEDRSDGIVYPSVRDQGGQCAAILRPPAVSATWQGRHLGYEWDGHQIRHVLELRLV